MATKLDFFSKSGAGRCVDGTRYVPIQIMDVAGLVPGASEGLGLGNQFLDDLRHAHALIHVVDVSGTTDQNGKETQGYDPINDINWLRAEIHSWISNNLLKRWGSIVRRHVALSKPKYMEGTNVCVYNVPFEYRGEPGGYASDTIFR